VIPFAAGVLYGNGLGLPLLISSLLKWFGNNVQEGTPVVSAIGIYGYSFSSFLLVSMLCAMSLHLFASHQTMQVKYFLLVNLKLVLVER
jgi:hypothetical protein